MSDKNLLLAMLLGDLPNLPKSAPYGSIAQLGPTSKLAESLAKQLPPAQEQQYQTFMAFDPSVRGWRNSFANRYGEQPRTEGGDYDYRAAWLAGARPQAVPGDTVPHWSSVGKAADHPTMWKQDFMTKFGADPDAPGLQYTPEMQDFLAGEIGAFGLLGRKRAP